MEAMKSVGVDIVELDRIRRSVERFGDRFLRRIYTERELAYCRGRISSLAVRWAAKEAVAKALGTGIGAVGWRDIEVLNDAQQRPAVLLHGPAAQLAARLNIASVEISLSHARDYAVAFVVTA
jgi:holo-[acyl-carrier protein] synthase